MFPIATTKRMPDGVVIFWLDDDGKKFDTFSFSDLIDMRINTLDLLSNPQNYRFDPEVRSITFRKMQSTIGKAQQ